MFITNIFKINIEFIKVKIDKRRNFVDNNCGFKHYANFII